MDKKKLIKLCEDYLRVFNSNLKERIKLHIEIVKLLAKEYKLTPHKIREKIQVTTDNLDKCFHLSDDEEKNIKFAYHLTNIFINTLNEGKNDRIFS